MRPKYPVTITFSNPLTPEQMREVAVAVKAYLKKRKGGRKKSNKK